MINYSSVAYLAFWVVNNIATNFSVSDIVITKATISAPTITAQLGTKSVTSSALSIVSGTFTKFVLNFEATASEVNQDLKLWLSGAGSVYVDKLSLTQAYDYAVKIPSLKHLANASGIFGTNIASQNQMGIYATTTYLRFEIGNSYAAGQYFEVNQTNAIISDLLFTIA